MCYAHDCPGILKPICKRKIVENPKISKYGSIRGAETPLKSQKCSKFESQYIIKDFNSHLTLTKIKKRNLKIQQRVCGGGGGCKYGPNPTRPFGSLRYWKFKSFYETHQFHGLLLGVARIVTCTNFLYADN